MSTPCKISDHGCVYHACMSDDCQKEHVLKYNHSLGPGKCDTRESWKVALALSTVKKRFITHFKSDSWGDQIVIMEKRGKAFARIYWYHDDDSTVYLDSLSVDISARKQGIGTELQQLRERMGLLMGASKACLWVKRNTWMHAWYERRGYEYLNEHEEENAIWMQKLIGNQLIS